ncbi:MAG: hypothetical protein A2W98_10180 [Bacteroidetes bacterium GWF2_33_38]|nr:MAG: hypothetical protein A2W98_10180 [Bacteroidetes bacterium GWF2_33_38]OFY75130.1 MAG: hypothetical protein A2265_03155 [Bacteroidetes bacterium RIFOXYA12_FULL_33_9]
MSGFIIFILVALISFSQVNESQLALKYYQNKEFDKAADVYLKLYEKQKSAYFYSYYINCLLELKDYETAEKSLKKEIKKDPANLSLYVDYGFVFKVQNYFAKADEQFETAIKNIYPDRQQIMNLANAFIGKREFDYAEMTYRKGQKLEKDYDYNMELANLYYIERNYEAMIDEYLNLLETDENYIQTVQNRLQNVIYTSNDDSMLEILKSSLIKRIQKSPDISIFSELLIWIYIQDNDFENALTYTIAIDKRKKENGERLILLARSANTNERFEIAIEAYKYVISKGIDSEYYTDAKNEYLNSIYNKITNSGIFTKIEIEDLEKSYLETLDELGKKSTTISLIKELAHLQGFYLHKVDSAISLLEKSLEIPGVKPSNISECKIALGDLYLLNNDVWAATIFYGQVEKNDPNSLLGHEAKFKKAKLAYYVGDFQWAEAQLDVLKASTSKLISNDAFYLASIISDNLALDTSEQALKMYARADLLSFQRKDSLAMITLDSLSENFKTHSLADDVLYLKANIYTISNNYLKASELYEKIYSDYSYDILADDALYHLAIITEEKINDKEKAKQFYNDLLLKYPGSIFVSDSRQRYRKLRGDVLKKTEEKFFYDL